MSQPSPNDNSSTAGAAAKYKRLHAHPYSWTPLPLTPAMEEYVKSREGKPKPTIVDPRNETPTNDNTSTLSCTPELSARFTPIPHTIYHILDFIRPSDGKRIDKPGVTVRQVDVMQLGTRYPVDPIGGAKGTVDLYFIHQKIRHEICSSAGEVITKFSFEQKIIIEARLPDGTFYSAPMPSLPMPGM